MAGNNESAGAAVVAVVKPAHQASKTRPVTVGSIGLAIIAPLLAILALGDLYLLIQFWPVTAGVGEVPPKAQDVVLFGTTYAAVPREMLFFAVVILSGGLGGAVHSLRSLAWYVGGQRFVRSWVLNYFYLPIVGALTATILYLIIRAGFLAGSSVDATSPYGFAAMGALAGLFSEQGVRKLKDVFETLLTKPEQGPNSRHEAVSEAGSS